MSVITRYMGNLQHILNEVLATQNETMEKAAEKLAEATLQGNNIFAFGCSHAGLITLELYYRTGGMANINPVRAPGLNLDVDPATFTTKIERLPEYGTHIVDSIPLSSNDVIIIHSVSGRNTVTIDVALRAREKGAYVIALTNMNTTRHVVSRHAGGKNLYEVADLVIDNCGCVGDSSQEIDSIPEKVGPTSTVIGAAILNAIVVRTVELVTFQGGIAPVFVSANLDDGEKHNQIVLEKYRDHIFYM